MVVVQDVAVGFLYHAASGKVLLHLRAADKPPNPGKWAFFGGRCEPEDGGDLLATWRREMHEEIGVTLDPASAVSLRHGAYADGVRWHDFYAEWPSLDEDFILTEGQRRTGLRLNVLVGSQIVTYRPPGPGGNNGLVSEAAAHSAA